MNDYPEIIAGHQAANAMLDEIKKTWTFKGQAVPKPTKKSSTGIASFLWFVLNDLPDVRLRDPSVPGPGQDRSKFTPSMYYCHKDDVKSEKGRGFSIQFGDFDSPVLVPYKPGDRKPGSAPPTEEYDTIKIQFDMPDEDFIAAKIWDEWHAIVLEAIANRKWSDHKFTYDDLMKIDGALNRMSQGQVSESLSNGGNEEAIAKRREQIKSGEQRPRGAVKGRKKNSANGKGKCRVHPNSKFMNGKLFADKAVEMTDMVARSLCVLDTSPAGVSVKGKGAARKFSPNITAWNAFVVGHDEREDSFGILQIVENNSTAGNKRNADEVDWNHENAPAPKRTMNENETGNVPERKPVTVDTAAQRRAQIMAEVRASKAVEGASVEDIAAKVGISVADVRKFLVFMIDEGMLYSTTDDDHVKAAE
jgi:hypothetical protein